MKIPSPEEKAYELVLKFEFKKEGIRKELAKRSALIALDEIFKFMDMDDEENECLYFANSKWVQYFMDVEKEIKKL